MLGGSKRNVPTGGTLWIVVLALIFVGTIALAIPRAPFDIDKNVERGFLVGHSRFSDRLAEQLVDGGYTYLAIELTQARLERGEDTFWRRHLEIVARRRLPIWGWVDVSQDPEHARNVVRDVNLAGLFVAGRGAVKVAQKLRKAHGDFRIVPVVRLGAVQPQKGKFAVALTGKEFVAKQGEFELRVLPVLISLDDAEIRAARAAADGHYLVAKTTIPD